MTACSSGTETPEPSTQAAPSTATTTAKPVDPACEKLAALPLRDKLAQLVMVGVRDAADAHAVVTDVNAEAAEAVAHDIQAAGHKGTAFAANIAVGADADLCLFSPENIRENGAYTAPRQLASGMDAVFVAGVPEIMDGQFTGETRGRVLRAH